MYKIILALLFISLTYAESFKDSEGNIHLKDSIGNELIIFTNSTVEYNNISLGNCDNEVSRITSNVIFNCDGLNDISLVDRNSQFHIDGNSVTIHSNGNIEQFEINDLSLKNNSLTYENIQKELDIKQSGDDLQVNLNSDILFDFDSAKVQDNAKSTLEKLAYAIKQKAKGYIVISGYTDNKGSDHYNLNLSEKRANAVAAWLNKKHAINMKNIIVKGYGENYPVAPNVDENGEDDPNGRTQNRRVEIVIQTIKKDPNYLIRDLSEANELAKEGLQAGKEGLTSGLEGLNEGLGNSRVQIDNGRVVVEDDGASVDVSNDQIFIQKNGSRVRAPQGNYGSVEVNEDSIEAGAVKIDKRGISAGNVDITEDGIEIGND